MGRPCCVGPCRLLKCWPWTWPWPLDWFSSFCFFGIGGGISLFSTFFDLVSSFNEYLLLFGDSFTFTILFDDSGTGFDALLLSFFFFTFCPLSPCFTSRPIFRLSNKSFWIAWDFLSSFSPPIFTFRKCTAGNSGESTLVYVDEISDGGPWLDIQSFNELPPSFFKGFLESRGLSMLRRLLKLPGGVGMFICKSIFWACSWVPSVLGEATGDLGPDDTDIVGDCGTWVGPGLVSRFVLPEGLAGDFEAWPFPMELKLPEMNQYQIKVQVKL